MMTDTDTTNYAYLRTFVYSAKEMSWYAARLHVAYETTYRFIVRYVYPRTYIYGETCILAAQLGSLHFSLSCWNIYLGMR